MLTLTDKKSTAAGDTIYVSSNVNKSITVQNINVDSYSLDGL